MISSASRFVNYVSYVNISALPFIYSLKKPFTLSLNRTICCSAPLGTTESGEVVDVRDASKDRSQVIPVETSIKYLKSSAYKETYGDDPVWKHYRRNHKGVFAPLKTRKTCIRNGVISTGNPCPICRDEYLVVHEKNIDLLKQFITPHSGEVLSAFATGLCRKKHELLLICIDRAKDVGDITYDVPFRKYSYEDYDISK